MSIEQIWAVPKFEEVMLCSHTPQLPSHSTRPMSTSSFHKPLPWDNYSSTWLKYCHYWIFADRVKSFLEELSQISTLKTTCGKRLWIGRGGPVNWPARSSDLFCLDFFLWGHMKNLVNASNVDSNEALVARIAVVAGKIREMSGLLTNVQHSLRRRSFPPLTRKHFPGIPVPLRKIKTANPPALAFQCTPQKPKVR
ncbi:uncharacterized protein TNCV_4331081 [Trichonephila clavipes]|nr:uncharacterized protein TNCV_4331081 [Trichonephila clavipes]